MRHRANRITTLLLAAALLLTLCVPVFAADMTTVTVNAPAKLPAVGQSFTVSVNVSAKAEYNSIQLLLNYDKSVVECTEAKAGSALKGALNAANGNAIRGAMIAAASVEPLHTEGTAAEFTFKVLKDGKPGLWLSDVSLSNMDGECLSFDIKQASIATEPEEAVIDYEKALENPKRERFDGDDPNDDYADLSDRLFSDVPASFWACSQIERAASLGLVAGYDDGSFKPNAGVTRAQFVLMLWRMAGQPESETEAEFTDTKGVDWYRDALNWAVEKEYVTGVGGGKFNPNGSITRQQAMAILFRYSGGQSGMETMFTADYDAKFTDHDQIAAWAKPAVYWAIYKSVLTGATASTVAPNATASRAQIAVILLRYMDNVMTKEETDR